MENFFCPKNWGNGQKQGFLNLKKNLVINFHCVYSIWKILFAVFLHKFFGKNLVPEIQAKTLSANQIAGFLNESLLLSKLMKQSLFQHVNMGNWLMDSKIELTNRINLFFACWYNMKINLKVLGVGMVKNGCGQSCDGTLKLTLSEE